MAKIGRPKGSRNKRSLEVQARLKAMDFDPVAMLVSFAQDEDEDKEFRRKCAADVLPYLYPRLQATKVDISGKIDHAGIVAIPEPVDLQAWQKLALKVMEPKELPS